MNEELDSFEGTITIGGRPITNLKFADDIDLIAGEEAELTELNQAVTKYGMEINAEKLN